MKRTTPVRAHKQVIRKRAPALSSQKNRAGGQSDSPDERLRQLSRAVEQSPATVVITDIAGNIEYVNPRFTQVTGYTFDEAIGKNPRILKSGEMSPEGYPHLWETLTAGGEWHGEFHNRKKNGELYWESAVISPITDSRGTITHFLAVKEDITERKRVEAALRTSEQYARSIIESSLDMIIAVDNQRIITEFNPAAEKTFGYSREQVIGKHVSLLYADSQKGDSVHHTVYRQGTLAQEILNKRQNGETFPAYLSASVMRNEEGEALGVVGVSRDITESKYAEEALMRRDAALSAVTFAAERFLRSSSWEEHIHQVLEQLGTAMRVSRIYLFENHFDEAGTLYWRQRHEWTAPQITPQIDNPELQNFSVESGGLSRWREIFEKGEFIQSHVKNLPEGEQSALRAQGIQSIVLVPIFAKQTWWGFIGFDECLTERDWSVAEVDALVAAAETLGAAIEREWVDQELRTRARHLELLNEITRASIATSDLRQMLQLIADQLGSKLNADGCFITLWDEEHDRAIPMVAYGSFREIYSSNLPLPGEVNYTQSVLDAGHPLVIEDAQTSPYASRRIAALSQTQSILCLPLIDSGRKLGAALIGFDQFHRFSRDEVELATQASAEIALAIAKAQSFAAEQRRAAELEALRQASLSVTSILDLSAVLDAILESMLRLTPDAQDAHIYMYADGQLTFGNAHGKDGRKSQEWSPPRENGLTYTVARTGEMIIVPDIRSHPLFVNTPSNWQGAIIGLPLKIGDRVVGVMTIAFEEARGFAETELRALRLLALQAAIGIENARLYDQVQRLAVTDPLTSCYNRRGFAQLGGVEFDRAWRFNRALSALMIDVDHFKRLNDAHGHAVGDKVLTALADCCRHGLRAVDIVGRHGGEEFVVLLPETDMSTAQGVAERLRRAVEQIAVFADGQDLHITVSLGVATLTPQTPNLDVLIEHADLAQYRAKQAGRNTVMVYEN